ncbi:helix-hairpin-helix domain-containing protein [uncultured Lactobacillus sp.]|uniref:helix-hairpin-helix domain-containing protein n=1 Tax=uncultured Lactobacillus sp. TaxID=153152 RepID=UPI002628CF35|nr:helix-hairpin-helix domain-containing protein [uncultured Lactobacillus sp.]
MDIEKIKAYLVEQKKYVIGIVLAIVFLGMYWNSKDEKEDFINDANTTTQLNSKTPREAMASSVSSNTNNAQTSTNNAQTSEVTCDISGAVKRQGVYRLKNGAPLEDLIEKAGGLTKDAQLQAINRSQLLKDQDKIYIPGKGDKAEADQTANSAAASAPASSPSASSSSSSVSSSTSGASSGDLINLNTATASDLQKLNGIGEKKAEQIIAYRQEKGSFKSIDELKEVSGIGDKTFAAIKDQLTI